MDKKSIWIINQYASTPETGMAGRSFYICNELAKLGNDITLICSGNHHLLKEKQKFFGVKKVIKKNLFTLCWLNNLEYKSPNSFVRAIGWIIFSVTLLLTPFFKLKHPDVIIYSSPSLVGYIGAYFLSKYFKCKLVFEIRDIWPETLIKLGNYSRKNVFIKLLKSVEKFGYQRSDLIISNLENFNGYVKNLEIDSNKIKWVPNGYCSNEKNNVENLNNRILSKMPKNKFIVGYAGSIGLANALDTFIEAAKNLKHNKEIAFVLVGDGHLRQNLISKVAKYKLKNVTFIDLVPKKGIPQVLKKFDICYIGWKKSPLYQYGIAANKIFDYMVASKPILHAYSGGGDPIKKYNCGIVVEPENDLILAEKILFLSKLEKNKLNEMGMNGKLAAAKFHDYSKIALKLNQLI